MTTADKRLTRRRVIAAQLETTEGTAVALAGTENNVRVLEASFDLIGETFERETVGDDFTPNAPTAPGVELGQITFTTELTQPTANSGTDDIANSLSILPYLVACGMQEIDNTRAMGLPATWTSGEYIGHGEVIRNTTESENANAVGHTGVGFNRVWFTDPTTFGDWNNEDTLTSPASAPLNAQVDPTSKTSGEKKSYRPRTSLPAISSLTIALYNDGGKVELKGARGTFTISGSFGETVRIAFTFQGVVNSTGDATLPTASIADQVPPSFASVNAVVSNEVTGDSERGFELSQFSFDMGNELQNWTDASNTDGYSCTAIVGRRPTLSLNPSHKLVSSGFNWLAAKENGNPIDVEMTIGDDTQAGTAFALVFGGAVINQSPDGDRDGLEILDIQAGLSKGFRGANGDGEFAMHLI